MKNKHAYLIMAHRNDMCFYTLLQLIDDRRNDIFIHMDAKNRKYDAKEIEKIICKSKVYHIDRTNVTWGGFSMVNAELLLLKTAVSTNHYQFYHLLSGQDLPIKSQEEIHSFFDGQINKNFIRFQDYTFSFQNRVRVWHFFQEFIGRKSILLKSINRYIVKFQLLIGVCRNKDVVFQKGTNWFSISDSFARYVVDHANWIKKIFTYTFCCDEVFIQTLMLKSQYLDTLYHKEFDNSPEAIMRLIDWNRGKPYVFRSSDFEELVNSNMLFARKFESEIDSEIIDMIKNHILAK